jgi:hypothetical protein
VKVTGADGVTRRVPLDMLLVFFGLSPKLGPIAEWGLDIERRQLKVWTPRSSRPTCRASSPWATSTPIRARRS